MELSFRFFGKYKVQPIEYATYELDCKIYNGIYLETRSQFKSRNNLVIYKWSYTMTIV